MSDRRKQISYPSPNEKRTFLRENKRRLILKNATEEHKMRLIFLIQNILFGINSVGYMVESVHGAGPPAAQKSRGGLLPRSAPRNKRLFFSLGTEIDGGIRWGH